MPLAIRCPRCEQEIQIPATLAGKKAVCPSCGGSFWVPARIKEAAAAGVGSGQVVPGPQEAAGAGLPSRGTKPPPTEGLRAGPGEQPAGAFREVVATASGKSPLLSKADPSAPPKRVARLIIEESVPSALVLTPDGQLPSLRLADEEHGQQETSQERGVHPLILLALITMSAVVSLALLFLDFGTTSSPDSPAKVQARYSIEREYFADLDDPSPRVPYQLLLREAQRAYARGDYKREQELYRRVLELLRQERPQGESLTGSTQRDRRLEELLVRLLAP